MSLEPRSCIAPSITEFVNFLIVSRTRVAIFYVLEDLLNSKNLMDLLGLKRVAPVPLCLETLYLPLGDRDSGFSYLPAPGLLF